MNNLDAILSALRAAGEHTRLRLLFLCDHRELSASELTHILGQSQPRVARHLKVMVEANLLERYPEGSQVFYRRSDNQIADALSSTLLMQLDREDSVLSRDYARLRQVIDARAFKAQKYFREVAANWDNIRSLHVQQAQLEKVLLEEVGPGPVDDLLDIGTGTGRILEILANRAKRGCGIDLSSPMLAVARVNLDKANLSHVQIRHGDMTQLPFENDSYDLVTIHMVLHHCDEPDRVIHEAARVLRPEGRLFIVDFAAHNEEELRSRYEHVRLGFTDREIKRYLDDEGLKNNSPKQLIGKPLTIKIWLGEKKANRKIVKLDAHSSGKSVR